MHDMAESRGSHHKKEGVNFCPRKRCVHCLQLVCIAMTSDRDKFRPSSTRPSVMCMMLLCFSAAPASRAPPEAAAAPDTTPMQVRWRHLQVLSLDALRSKPVHD